MTGDTAAIRDSAVAIVKLDADGEMDPFLNPELSGPALEGWDDCTKGNRLASLEHAAQAPKLGLLASLALTMPTRAASGYWNIADPTNGYTCLSASAVGAVTGALRKGRRRLRSQQTKPDRQRDMATEVVPHEILTDMTLVGVLL